MQRQWQELMTTSRQRKSLLGGRPMRVIQPWRGGWVILLFGVTGWCSTCSVGLKRKVNAAGLKVGRYVDEDSLWLLCDSCDYVGG